MLFNQFALVYLAFLLVPLAAFVLYRTPWGLALRMVGENPRAAVAAGVNVIGRASRRVVLGGALMGVAGAFLSMAQFNAFTFGVISGRGWVASRWSCSAAGIPGGAGGCGAAVRRHRCAAAPPAGRAALGHSPIRCS